MKGTIVLKIFLRFWPAALLLLAFQWTPAAAQPSRGNTGPRPTVTFAPGANDLVDFDFAQQSVEQQIPLIYRGDRAQRKGYWKASRFAGCAVRLSESRAKQMLDSFFAGVKETSTLETRYYERFDTCAPVSGLVDTNFVRGSMAEIFVTKMYPASSFRPVGSEAELLAFLGSVEARNASAGDILTTLQLGYQCRVALSPYLARDVLDHEVGSAQERDTLEEFYADTPLCDRFFGRGERLTHWFERGFTARALYYLQMFSSAKDAS
ncbi:hypothetical protein [Paraurantiacibacter namhicola]|uniref:hypothetical protein n=1 Tax=Paraurantiacibacter namhicola TaxID=645517 RepID=UPI0012ECF59E|nr:hypothetical protein [Paraurantiacibacter namhicola]